MRNVLFLIVMIPDIAVVFERSALTDGEQPRIHYRASVLRNTDNLSALFKSEAAQNIQWINLLTDGIWTLLIGILGAIGLKAGLSDSKS